MNLYKSTYLVGIIVKINIIRKVSQNFIIYLWFDR